MPSFRKEQSRALTSYSRPRATQRSFQTTQRQPSNFWLRKSIFNPPYGLAETFAARRHLAGADVPRIYIVHYNPRWLLLQAPQAKANYFLKVNGGKLGCKEEQILKLFKNFVALVRNFGLFRPTERMIFLEKMEVRVWMNEDIFSNVPMMPITGGGEGEKHFVIAFLAMVQTYIDNWQRVSNVTTINDTLKMLQWRCQLAKGSKAAVYASQEVNYRAGESTPSLVASQIGMQRMLMSSQHLTQFASLSPFHSNLSYSANLNDDFSNQVKLIKVSAKKTEREEHKEEENEVRTTKKKFALNSTSSTIGAFSQKWRTTIGRKKLLEKVEGQESITHSPPGQLVSNQPPHPGHIQNIQMQFEGLFAQEMGEGFDEAELERITEEIEQVLI